MVESFHRVSLVGIGLNAVAIPLLALILALGLPCSFLAITWPAGAEPLAELLAALLSLLSGLTEISGLPGWMAYRVPSPPCGWPLDSEFPGWQSAWQYVSAGAWRLPVRLRRDLPC